jgi:flagellin-specific chaperone FliS
MSEQTALSRLQAILDELDKSLQSVEKLTTLSDNEIDSMLSAETPEQVKTPAQTRTQQALSQAAAQEDATRIQQTLQTLNQATSTWMDYVESESQRAVARATAPAKVQAHETKIVQRVTAVKPPPELPEPFSTWLVDISYILYNYIIAGLLGEIEIKPTDLDRYIDDFIKICELVVRVKVVAAGSS